MKHGSKALLLVLVLTLCIGIFAACSNVKGLTKEGEALNNPETVARNKEPYSATLIPYASVEQSLGDEYEKSPYYKSLNGEWDFSLVLNPTLVPKGFESEKYSYKVQDIGAVRMNKDEAVTWSKIPVPSNWEMQGFDAPSYTYNSYPWGNELVAPAVSESYNPVGLYRNKMEIPADWKDRQVYINFDGVASCVYLYVNGALVGYAEDSYTGKTFNITDAVKFGKENLIVFEVYKYCDASYLEANDSIKFGGVYRDVYLYSAPETQIRDFTYDMQMDGQDALMNVTVALASYDKPSDDMTVLLSVYDSEGTCVQSATQVGKTVAFSEKPVSNANARLGEVGGRVSVKSPKLWSAESPNLYTVVLELRDGDEVLDVVSKRIGFKTVSLETLEGEDHTSFLLNGEPVVLRGILYNENSAVNGMAVTREEMIADIKQMKALNVNAVRSPGRPLSPEFISLCDEYGLYVIDDMSLNSNPVVSDDGTSIPGNQTAWQNACLDRLLNVVYRDKNSASVIMWAIGSDSGIGTNFSALRNWLIDADNRMIVYDDDESSSDLLIGRDLSLNDLVAELSDPNNKKPVLVQDTRGALLNNGGNFSAYAELVDEYPNFQGGFFGYWSDNAVYWPLADASITLQKSPYNDQNASLYRLSYSGGWGETIAIRDGYKALSGVVTADRKLQSDALELKNALSPVYISLVDAKTGTFRISSRDSFSAISDLYEVAYEVTDGKKVLASGKVSDLTVEAGQAATFAVDTSAEGALYVFFTVTYKNAPAWSDSEDLTVFEKQISLSEDVYVDKDGTVQNQGSEAITLSQLYVPDVYVSMYSYSQGEFYVTNKSNQALNDLYSVSWVTYERHDYWENLRWKLFDEGSVSGLKVPANVEKYRVSIPLKGDGASSAATYAAYLILTTKVEMGGLPAGTQLVYPLNSQGAEEDIPFVTDEDREMVTVGVDEASGNAILELPEVDKEPPVVDDDPLHFVDLPEPASAYGGTGFVQFSNSNMTVKIDAATGLLTQYTVNGKDIVVANDPVNASMLPNLVRYPTGGDLVSSSVTNLALATLKGLSQSLSGTLSLPDGYQVTKISDTHYRVTLDYVWVVHPVANYMSFSLTTSYTIVYDVYASGEIQVSVEYAPNVKDVAPIELSSIMVLTNEFKTMSWYGMGSGDSYSDKTANNRVGVYEDVAIIDQLGSEYIYSTGCGDKTDLRWLALEREDGSGIVITSDSKVFAANVSKDYPNNTVAYAPSSVSLASKNTILRVIGQQRGVSANTLFDEEHSNANYIIPGVVYSYSFRVVPVSAGYDADAISQTTLSGSATEEKKPHNLANNSFGLVNAATPSVYLSSGAEGIIALNPALGNASQIWIKEAATDTSEPEAFRLQCAANGLYLSPVSKATGASGAEIEMTVAEYKGLAWQNWTYEDNQLFAFNYATSASYGLHLAGRSGYSYSGARLMLKLARSDPQSKWTMNEVDKESGKFTIQSNLSKKYLTLVDSIEYTSPIAELEALHRRYYPLSINWLDVKSFDGVERYPSTSTEWTSADYYVTQWDLLPADSQLWTFVPAGDGYMLVNKQTGNALTLTDGVLSETAASSAAGQIWTVIFVDGMYGIVNGDQALTVASVNGQSVLTVREWSEIGIQLWDLSSDADRKVNVVAGDNWYTY